MDKFITVVSSSEFWVAMLFAFAVSFVLAVIIQDTVNRFIDLSVPEYVFTDEEPYFGCLVYDTENSIEGIYCGTHLKNDTLCGVVVTVVEDNTIHCYYPDLKNLKTIEQQE